MKGPMSSSLPLWKRAIFIPCLLFALWCLTDDEILLSHVEENADEDGTTTTTATRRSNHHHHHFAVWTAFQRHPPCARVYRSLLEINLLLWGATLSFWLWNRTIGKTMISHLLFQPVIMDESAMISSHRKEDDSHGRGFYLPVDVEDRSPLTPEDILMLGRTKPTPPAGSTSHTTTLQDDGIPLQESWDAHYDSDGEVNDPEGDNDDGDHHHHVSSFSSSRNTTTLEPPDAEDLARISIDWLVLILISLFFFTLSSAEGGQYVDGMPNVGIIRMIALIAAPIFPLVLFLAGMVAVILPWKTKRMQFWKLISLTMGAPLYRVTFRDGLMGDIITSSVRPMRDIAFTFFYICSGLQGWWKQAYDLDTAGGLPLETNWFLHTIIFPACMFSPLWWRFLQTLRQSYESKQRWPYLGNAFKYFIAAEVAIFGVFHPSSKDGIFWLSCFVIATMYQIFWDIFMDWELLVVEDGGKKIRLRHTRIYSVEWMYWMILMINIILRFCWTLSFLPPHYLNRAGVLSDQFEGDVSHFLNPTIASAEIIRRTLWGFLRVELEAIKEGRKNPTLKGAWSDIDYDINNNEMEMKNLIGLEPVEIGESSNGDEQPPSMTPNQNHPTNGWIATPTTRSEMTQGRINELHFLGELCLYATAFTALGLIAAAHRITF